MQSMLPMGAHSHRITRSDYVNSLLADHRRIIQFPSGIIGGFRSIVSETHRGLRSTTHFSQRMDVNGSREHFRGIAIAAYERAYNGIKIRIRGNGWRLAWNQRGLFRETARCCARYRYSREMFSDLRAEIRYVGHAGMREREKERERERGMLDIACNRVWWFNVTR
jgi:hypothetical protein